MNNITLSEKMRQQSKSSVDHKLVNKLFDDCILKVDIVSKRGNTSTDLIVNHSTSVRSEIAALLQKEGFTVSEYLSSRGMRVININW